MSGAAGILELIPFLELKTIVPIKLESERLSDPPGTSVELQLNTNLQFSDDDPVRDPPGTWSFRPRMICEVNHGSIPHFRQTVYFVVTFGLSESDRAEELWKDESVRQDFQTKQLTKTLWPLFRQQVIDGMSRVGLPYVTLPWLL